MKTLYCAGCSKIVAKIEPWSKLRTGMVVLCQSCEVKRKASDLAIVGNKQHTDRSFFDEMFGSGRS